jgi:hypothetical protein
MRFGRIVGLFTVILDHQDKETRKSIDVQVRIDSRATLNNVDVAIDANFDADPEKHGARIIALEDSSALQFNRVHEEVTVSGRSLVELHPVYEELLQLWVKIVKILGQAGIRGSDCMDFDTELLQQPDDTKSIERQRKSCGHWRVRTPQRPCLAIRGLSLPQSIG